MRRIKTTLWNAVVITVLLFLIGACDREKPEPPVASTLDSLLYLPQSKLVVPIYLEVANLQQVINEKIKGTFIKKKIALNEKRDSLYLEVSRIGTIRLKWQVPNLSYTLPVRISGKITKYIAGVKLHNETPIIMDLVLHMKTEVHLDKRWNLSPTTQLIKVDWKKEPKLNVGGVKINVRKPIESVLETEKEEFLPKLDEGLAHLLPTRKIVSKLWLDIQKPIRINKNVKEVWLATRAEGITGSFIDAGKEHVAIHIMLNSRSQFRIQGQKMPTVNKRLPDFKRKVIAHDSVMIVSRGRIPFKMINSILKNELVDKELSANGFSTTIKDIEVYASADGGIAMKIKVEGDVDGLLYVTGKLHFDQTTGVLRVNDFTYDIDSENSLIHSANWLMHDSVLEMVREKLELPLGQLFEKIPSIIDQAVSKGKLGEKIDVELYDMKIGLDNFLITKNDIQVIAVAHGRAGIELQKKIFAKKKK